MRILIATVTAGAGHLQAAAALEEAWRAARLADTVERVDVLDFVSKLSRKLYSEGYVKVIDHAPELYAHLFKKTDSPALMRKLTRVRRSFAGRANARFIKHVKAFRPDVMLCTHFLPLEIIPNTDRTCSNALDRRGRSPSPRPSPAGRGSYAGCGS